MNLIFLLVDALRYDCFSFYKNKSLLDFYDIKNLADSPVIDELFLKSTFFETAISCAPDTPTSHASILTGLYPPMHGIRSFFERLLPGSAKTLFELGNENGYETVCVADPFMFKFLGLSRGARHNFAMHNTINAVFHDVEPAKDEVLFKKLNKMKNDNVLLFVRFTDVHFPYFLPDSVNKKSDLTESFNNLKEICGRFNIEFNLNENSRCEEHKKLWLSIRGFLQGKKNVSDILFPYYIKNVNHFFNNRFKTFITNLEDTGILTENDLLVITADHGEAPIASTKVEDGKTRFDHCYTAIDQLLRVPIFLKCPELPKGKIISDEVSSVDIFPTVRQILNLKDNNNSLPVQGKSLLPLIEKGIPVNSICYSEHSWWNDGSTFESGIDFEKKCYNSGSLLDYIPVRREKSVRKDFWRYVVKGEEIKDVKNFKDNRHFIEGLFRKIYANWPDSIQTDKLVEELDSKKKSRVELLKSFYAAAIANGKYALYNIKDDPSELVNLFLIDFEKYKEKIEILQNIVKDINAKTADYDKNSNKDNILDGSEIKILYKNLEDLGYV